MLGIILAGVILAGSAVWASAKTEAPLPLGQPNALKMEGAAPTFDQNVAYGSNFFQAVRSSDGTYTIVMYFDPQAVETLVPELNEQIRIGAFEFAAVKVYLGNLNDKGQRKNMPVGEVDLEHRRVTFRGVKLSGTERVNMPVEFYDANGKKIPIPNDRGGPLGKGYAWGWIPSAEASVEGTPHNGWRFEVQPNGDLIPKGVKVKPIP